MMHRKQLKPRPKFKPNTVKKRNPAFSSGGLPGSGGGMVSQPVQLAAIKLRIQAVLEPIDSPAMKRQVLREALEELG